MGINKLIIIGFVGSKRCYMNIGREAAIGRYLVENDIERSQLSDDYIEELEFDDEFSVYDIWNV